MPNSQMPKGAKASTPPTQQQQEAVKRLSGLFNKEKPYTPIAKSLVAAGIEPRIMDVKIAGQTQECLVIPVQELIYKEWKHMTGGIEKPAEVPEIRDMADDLRREAEEDGDRSPEVG